MTQFSNHSNLWLNSDNSAVTLPKFAEPEKNSDYDEKIEKIPIKFEPKSKITKSVLE